MDIGIEQARKNLGDIANRASLAGETTYLTRNGKRVAAIVPLESVLTTTTVLARGAYLSGDDIANGWRDFLLNDVYTPDQENAIVAALVKAQEEEFDKLLPDGCVWYPATSEIVGPVGIELGDEDEVKDLMQDAASEVAAHRASKIEAELSA